MKKINRQEMCDKNIIIHIACMENDILNNRQYHSLAKILLSRQIILNIAPAKRIRKPDIQKD